MKTLTMKTLMLMVLISFGGFSFAKTAKTQEIRFDALDVDGKTRTPDASYLSQKRGLKFSPLYKTKQDWEKKIQELAEYER